MQQVGVFSAFHPTVCSCPIDAVFYNLIFNQMRSCNQYKAILENSSINAMVTARLACPVMIQDNTKVSILPVMRQVTALSSDL